MYKLDINVDQKEEAAIRARRAREEERKRRIFDPRVRTLGIDYQTLEEQIKEKNRRNELERLRDEAYAAEARKNDKIAVILAERELADRRKLLEQLNEFRSKKQRVEDRREFDLNDPESLKKTAPLRTEDIDNTLGPASLLKFMGEDSNEKARRQKQSEQNIEWLKRQIAEKQQAEKAARDAERLHMLQRRACDERACELAKAEEDCRRAIREATNRYNEALANERSYRESIKKKNDEADKLAEIQNSLFSDMLTEDPHQSISALGPGRHVSDRYKGMSPAQLKDILRIRAEQVAEKERMKKEAEREDAEWQTQMNNAAKIAELLTLKQQEIEAENRKRLAETNLRLAKGQITQRRHLDKDVYTNEVTTSFFDQFNTGSR